MTKKDTIHDLTPMSPQVKPMSSGLGEFKKQHGKMVMSQTQFRTINQARLETEEDMNIPAPPIAELKPEKWGSSVFGSYAKTNDSQLTEEGLIECNQLI